MVSSIEFISQFRILNLAIGNIGAETAMAKNNTLVGLDELDGTALRIRETVSLRT